MTDEQLGAISGRLDLRRMGIAALQPKDFSGLSALSVLNLSYNELTSLPSDVFDGLASLQQLNLERNALNHLPAEVFRGLTALQMLDLWQNQLTTLPAGVFSDLINLVDLDLEENELERIPARAFDGLDLRFLGLEGNRLELLHPDTFVGLRASTLDLSHNRLRELPEGVFAGVDPYDFDLAVNRLRRLPAGLLAGMTRLRDFHINENPGARFTFAMVPEQVSGTNKFVVRVAKAAPFDMTTSVQVSGGELVGGASSVTVPQGGASSEELEVLPLAGAEVTVVLGSAPSVGGDSTRHHAGYLTEVAGPIILVPQPDSNLPPRFNMQEVFLSIPELTLSGTDVGLPVQAFDPDGHTLMYRLGGPAATRFGIDELSGQLLTHAALDFERRSSYTLLIVATDEFGARDVITVSVAVVNVDEPPAISGPAAVRFVEQGTGTVAEYVAIDPEGNAVRWELHGQDSGSVTLVEGVLRFREPPQYESPTDADANNIYSVSIQASDEMRTASLDVNVSVVERSRSKPPTGGGGGGGGGPPPVPIPSDQDFDWNVTRDIESLDRDHDIPTDIWSDGKTLWVLENSATGADAVFAYDLETGVRLADQEFELDRRNRFSHGIWSDGETIWVADSGQDQLFAYNLTSGERLGERDFKLAERNRDPRGIWSDSKTLYVLDSVKDALFVYDFETGELRAEYPLDKLNKSPRGIWSDGVMLWVSDDGAKRLFAYRVEQDMMVRHEDHEFTFRSLLKAGNGDARGIWSDGEVIYVVDEQDDHVYSYNLPDAIDARLASLSLSGVELDEFSPSRLIYAAMAETAATVTTVEAVATQEAATVVVEPSDTDGDAENGHQVELEAETEISITVTSSDGSRVKSYRILVEKPPCLTGLTTERLSEVTFVGGSVEDLDRCAREQGVNAFFHWTGDSWLLHAPDAPEFLSRHFRRHFEDGLPAGVAFIAATTETNRTYN